MPKTPDDLEAVRSVTTALGGFSPEEQERIIRWAREKLGLTPAPRNSPEVPLLQPTVSMVPPRSDTADSAQPSTFPKDLKTFVATKNPKSDVQFAATVAYFYRFESPLEQRRNEIDAEILQDACRLASRARLKHPNMTLNNAKNQGLIDSGSEAGKYTINTVGENLVAMILPSQADSSPKTRKSRTLKRAAKTIRRRKN